ncbi:von Willebrand factor, type A (modular protein) [Candidatus Sulfopaludibacter sp. SbA4]|nr:von Willebrand factor, type A (modular protein) [Candidatus Sulfopaludibacter sp. SbA4]
MKLLVAAALTTALLAQAPPQTRPADQEPAPIKVDVDVVSILASVRDKRGGLVANLEKKDFTVLEDGKPQEIKYFTRETDLPLTIGLLVDVSGSQRNLIEIEHNAASQFFSQVLRKKDEAFLIQFGEETELLQDYTNSTRLLNSALGQLRVSSGVGGLHPGPVPTAGGPRGTVLYDAVYLAANEKLRTEVGRKVIVVITDGVDQGSRLTINQAIEAAQKADAVIYSIDYSDPSAYGGFGMVFGGGGGEGYLRKMSDETGGHGKATCARCPTRPAGMSTRWTGGTPWTRSSSSCRTRCAASTPSATRPPTIPRTAPTASSTSSWATRTSRPRRAKATTR